MEMNSSAGSYANVWLDRPPQLYARAVRGESRVRSRDFHHGPSRYCQHTMGENSSFASALVSSWISVASSPERNRLMQQCKLSQRLRGHSLRPVVASSLLVFLLQTGAQARSQENRSGDSWDTRSGEICGAANQTLPKWAFEQESPEQAVQLLQDRLRSNPQDPMLNYQLGILYQAQNQFQKAIAQYWKSVSLDEDSDLYSLALASVLFHCKQGREAIQVLQTFLERHPESLRSIRFLCRIYVQEGPV